MNTQDQPTQTQSTSQAITQMSARIDSKIRAICARVRVVLVLGSLLLSVSIVALVIVGAALVDYVLRFPSGLRWIVLAGIGYVVFRVWRRWVGPALLLKISATDMALQVERQDPALRGMVASSIDLSRVNLVDDVHDEQLESQLIERSLSLAALRAASKRLENRRLPAMVRLEPFVFALSLFLVVGSMVTAIGVGTPTMALIGAGRVLSPWNEISWPKQHAITDTTKGAARAIDIAVPISALIGESGKPASSSTRATLSWRLLDDRNRVLSDWTRTMLVSQQRLDTQSQRRVYEQLVDAQSMTSKHESDSFVFEYTITTRDDQTGVRRISLVRPPKLLQTSVRVELPPYAQPVAQSGLVRSGVFESTKYDETLSPVLSGSRVVVLWTLSKAIELPRDEAPAWVAMIDSGDESNLRANRVVGVRQPSPESIELELVINESVVIEPTTVDAVGIATRTPIMLSLGVIDDEQPGAVIVEPARDEIVSAHARVDVRAELTDDLGIASGALLAARAITPKGSSGAPAELIDDGLVLTQHSRSDDEGSLQASSLHITLSHVLDVSMLKVSAGDQVWVQAMVRDLSVSDSGEFAAQIQEYASDPGAGVSTGESRSLIRVLRVVEDSQIIDQVRGSLNPIRSAMRQLDDQQAQLERSLRAGQMQSSADQRTLSDRLAATRRTIEQLGDTLTRNMLDDPALQSLLQDAQSSLEQAQEASEKASAQIDRGEQDNAIDNQGKVRDRIGELLSMLDRGQDSYLALRSIERLREELAAIRDDTAELSAKAAGKSVAQLSPDERSMLDRILDRQLQSAQDAAEALGALDEQAQQLEEQDPTQAEALRSAAAQGRSAQIEQKLNDASEQISSNQTASATQSQDEVLDELDEMLQELKNTIENRDNALRRELASIIESLKGLITKQQQQISLLGEQDAPSLSTAMITLMGNTLVVRDDAIGAFPETRSIADLITQSADAQSRAISALRTLPVMLDQASQHEQSSLLNLKSALEEAERLDDQAAQRQAQRLREELRDQYKQSLSAQVLIRDETLPMTGEQLNRRERAQARALSTTQDEIRSALGDLLKQTKELSDAPVFEMAHWQLDRLMKTSTDGLTESTISSRVVSSQQAAISVLTTLVEVLSDTPPNQDEEDFEDGSSGNGEGGSSGSGDEPVIPPIAQLKLLRTMQQLAAMQTRAYAEDPGSATETDIELLSELQGQLFEQGRKLIEQMSPNPNPGAKPQRPSGGSKDEPIESGEGRGDS